MTRIAIAGVGKIARDQHIPHILKNPAFDYVAAVTRGSTDGDGVPAFNKIDDMMKSGLGVEAISICTPPIGRFELLQSAFANGLDVLLEKPPAATISEAELFGELAAKAGRRPRLEGLPRQPVEKDPQIEEYPTVKSPS